jgi:thioredoxin reductase
VKQVDIRQGEDLRTIDNDAVVISIGGVLPTDLLMSVGIRFEKKFGER